METNLKSAVKRKFHFFGQSKSSPEMVTRKSFYLSFRGTKRTLRHFIVVCCCFYECQPQKMFRIRNQLNDITRGVFKSFFLYIFLILDLCNSRWDAILTIIWMFRDNLLQCKVFSFTTKIWSRIEPQSLE